MEHTKYKCTILIVDDKGNVIEHVETRLYDWRDGGSDEAWSEAKVQMDKLMDED